MNTVEAKLHVETGNVLGIDICADIDSTDWVVVLTTLNMENFYLRRARGPLARFKSIDTAHSAVKSWGWVQEVRVVT